MNANQSASQSASLAEYEPNALLVADGALVPAPDEVTHELIVAATNGDAVAAVRLLERMDAARPGGGLAYARQVAQRTLGTTEQDVLDGKFSRDELGRECTRRHLDALRKELSGDNPAPMESLLVDRVLVTHVQLALLERGIRRDQESGEPMDLDLAVHYDRRVDQLHKRYLSAIKALAQVRRLRLAPVQINVGQNQVNIASGAGVGPDVPEPASRRARELGSD